jgi:hypothetical protein
LPVKNNLAPLPRGIGYSITTHIDDGFETSRIVWDDAPVDVTADEALADYANSIKATSAIGKAKEFLLAVLADGPMLKQDIVERASGKDDQWLHQR